jgi:hypothetical protein
MGQPVTIDVVGALLGSPTTNGRNDNQPNQGNTTTPAQQLPPMQQQHPTHQNTATQAAPAVATRAVTPAVQLTGAVSINDALVRRKAKTTKGQEGKGNTNKLSGECSSVDVHREQWMGLHCHGTN